MTEGTAEELARYFYDLYCETVGGKAWDGRPLPSSADFFADTTKAKQADGWRAVASAARAIFC